jgi:predicted dehydrogenase
VLQLKASKPSLDERIPRMNHLSAAVVGTGFIGPVHVEGLRRIGVHVTGILGSRVDKSEQAARHLGLPRAYRNLDEILKDPRVDAVHLTSPNRFHFEQASKTIEAGKHVLCEKPLAMNSSESAQLVRLAESAGVEAAVNYNLRYYPLSIESRERIRRGELGTLFHVTGSYAQDWLFYPTDYNWRVDEKLGGELRAIADIGTHWLDLIQSILGQKIHSVFADLSTVHPHRYRSTGNTETFTGDLGANDARQEVQVNTEDFGSVLLRFDNGAKGVMWVSQVDAGRKNCLNYEIAGSKHSLHWNSETPNVLNIGHRSLANQAMIRDPSLMTPRASEAASYPGGHNEGFGDSFKQLFKSFYSAIERRANLAKSTTASIPNDTSDDGSLEAFDYPSFGDGHREILLCESILKSHQTETWVEVKESPS